MPASWTISFYPKCTRHVFLSHCAEDRESLVLPVKEQLERRGILSWLDRHDYPAGTDPYEALREGILRSRHILYFITHALLSQTRGWAIVERTYAGLLQDNMRFPGVELLQIELPLFFVPRDHPSLPRSVWQPIVQRGRFHRAGRGDPVSWARREIEGFVIGKQARASDIGKSMDMDPRFRQLLSQCPGLMDRVQALYPPLHASLIW